MDIVGIIGAMSAETELILRAYTEQHGCNRC